MTAIHGQVSRREALSGRWFAASFTGLSAGVYTGTADGFITGQNKPTCRIHTPTQPSQQCTVVGGQTASVSGGYTSGGCDA